MPDQPQTEQDILTSIHALIDTEHRLRAGDHDQDRLREVEHALDQCWDLLRQRRARTEFDQDPETAQTRSVSDVEHYQQ